MFHRRRYRASRHGSAPRCFEFRNCFFIRHVRQQLPKFAKAMTEPFVRMILQQLTRPATEKFQAVQCLTGATLSFDFSSNHASSGKGTPYRAVIESVNWGIAKSQPFQEQQVQITPSLIGQPRFQASKLTRSDSRSKVGIQAPKEYILTT